MLSLAASLFALSRCSTSRCCGLWFISLVEVVERFEVNVERPGLRDSQATKRSPGSFRGKFFRTYWLFLCLSACVTNVKSEIEKNDWNHDSHDSLTQQIKRRW